MRYTARVALIYRLEHAIDEIDKVIEDLATNHAGEPGVEAEIAGQASTRDTYRATRDDHKRKLGWPVVS